MKDNFNQQLMAEISVLESKVENLKAKVDKINLEYNQTLRELLMSKSLLALRQPSEGSIQAPIPILSTPPLGGIQNDEIPHFKFAVPILKENPNGLTSRELSDEFKKRGRNLGDNSLTILHISLNKHPNLFEKKEKRWFVK